MLTIVIDPGHGGLRKVGGSNANNATGPAGTLEKNVTLGIAYAIKAVMPESIELVLTRNSDVNLSLSNRAAKARELRADIFLSIHLNGWNTPNVQGTECFHHTNANPQSLNFARLIQDKVIQVTKLRDRGVKPLKLGVLNPMRHNNATASCLLEVSFLTDPAEEIRLNDQNYINRLGKAISRACQDYLRHKHSDILSDKGEHGRKEDSLYQTLRDNEEELEDGTSLTNLTRVSDIEISTFQVAKQSKPKKRQRNISSLQSIRGIGPTREKVLLNLNIQSLSDLAQIPKSKQKKCAEKVKVSVKTLEKWISQARL